MAGNAVSSVFGLAVLSGNFEFIIMALDVVYAFESAASEDFSARVFAQCNADVKRYLS